MLTVTGIIIWMSTVLVTHPLLSEMGRVLSVLPILPLLADCFDIDQRDTFGSSAQCKSLSCGENLV